VLDEEALGLCGREPNDGVGGVRESFGSQSNPIGRTFHAAYFDERSIERLGFAATRIACALGIW
jgi:hypothetical protein